MKKNLSIANKRESIIDKIFYYSLICFIFIFPFINSSTFLYGGTSVRSVALIFFSTILIIILSIWLFKRDRTFEIPRTYLMIPLILYLISITLSAIFGYSFENSFWSMVTRTSGLWYIIHLVFFAFISWHVLRDERNLNSVVLAIITSGAIFSFLSLFGPEGFNLFFTKLTNDGFSIGNSTFAGMFIFFSFIMSLYYLFENHDRKWWKYLFPIITLINPYIINISLLKGNISNGFVGEARNSAYTIIFSIILLSIIWLILKIKDFNIKKKIFYSSFFISIVLVIGFAISLLIPNGYFRNIYIEGMGGARPLVWEMSSKIIGQSPLLGYGMDNFERVFEKEYDNRILEDKYGAEAWFDRAHNVFIDQVVDNGFIGLFFYLLVFFSIIYILVFSILNSVNQKTRLMSVLILVYLYGHLIELQTAFDTTVSYPYLIVAIILSFVMYFKVLEEGGLAKINTYEFGGYIKYILITISLVFCLWSLFFGLLPFVRAQMMNGYIRTVGDSIKRIPVYPILFNSPVDEHSFLWRTATDFQRGISENPKILEDMSKVINLKKELSIIKNYYKEYHIKNPDNFRASLNFADILIYERLFGVDNLKEAQEVLDKAIELVPQSPQPYWMKAVAYLYMGKFNLAKDYANKSLSLNPDIKESKELVNYINTSIKNFPEIDLYFFRQI